MSQNPVMSRNAVKSIGTGLLIIILCVFAQSYNGRVHLHKSQVGACQRGLMDRADAIQADMDLAHFAAEASRKRRVDGDTRVADEYMDVSANARLRIGSRESRLLGADVLVLLDRNDDGKYAPRAIAEAKRGPPSRQPLRVLSR
jgi:hypothetical protein